MGLKAAGENGFKALVRSRVPQAFRTYDTLHEVRDAVLQRAAPDPSGGETVEQVVYVDMAGPPLGARQRTVAMLDGNVLLMSVPEAVGDVKGFANIVYNYIRDALTAAHIVIVALDEPEHLTSAKKEEQARRDAARKARTVSCSTDMAPCPLDDGFTREQLYTLPDVHLLKANRKCRTRLYDEVMKMVLDRVTKVMEQWAAKGHDTGALIFDGVEMRGCDRMPHEPRVLTVVGTDADLAAKFARDKSIGEGDVKLIALENRLRELISTEPEEFERYNLCITSTTDTDTFAVFLLDVAKRRVNPYAGTLHSIYTMRTTATKRDREVDPAAKATFLACDITLLEANVQNHLWSECKATPTADNLLSSMLALTSAAALCGCDFTLDGLRGSRFDHFYEALPKFIASEPAALAKFNTVLAPEPEVARTATQALFRVCIQASTHMAEKPRYKRQAQTVSEVSDTLLQRSIWACSYWAQNEHAATPEWGFLPVFGAGALPQNVASSFG